MRTLSVAVAALLLNSGCADLSEGAFEPVSMRGVQQNDTVLQGPGLVFQGPGLVFQGPGLVFQGPGLVFQGPGLVFQGPGLVFQGITFQGPGLVFQGPGVIVKEPGIVLNGSTLSATVVHEGVEYQASGLDFIGAELTLRITSKVGGQTQTLDVILRIDDITQSEQHDDVYLYDLSYRQKNSNAWQPYCGNSEVAAIPLQNWWNVETGDRVDNAGVVTFACQNAALAKCALLGYRPWATGTSCEGKKKQTCGPVSLQDHHQACSRMLRADFCGDGEAMTVDGTAIDVFDGLAPQIQTRFTDWPAEAEWTPEGASCVNFVRHPELGYPGCFMKKNKPMKFKKCGDLVGDGLLVSAFSAVTPQ